MPGTNASDDMVEEAKNPSSPSIFVLVLKANGTMDPTFIPCCKFSYRATIRSWRFNGQLVGEGRTSRNADPSRSREKAF